MLEDYSIFTETAFTGNRLFDWSLALLVTLAVYLLLVGGLRLLRTKLFLCLLVIVLLMHQGVAYAQKPGPVTAELAKTYGLDPDFYSKATMAGGILIASSARVSDYAHLETAYLFRHLMRALKPRIAQRIREDKVLCVLAGHKELTSDIPQFKSDKTGKDLDFYNWRSRGFLTLVDDRRVVLFSEEDVLEYEGGMQRESILIHEFGHVIHRPGFYEGLDEELMQTWQAAMDTGLWNDGYASQRFRRVRGTSRSCCCMRFVGRSRNIRRSC